LRTNILKLLIGALAVIGLATATSANAATTTVRVDSNGDAGWTFNPDPANATPYHFTTDEQSIGFGSLFVEPISSTPAHKFIGGLSLGVPVADLESISYDFLIAGNGTAASAKQFYLNVYANIDDSNNFYDCRFDYIPLVGSTTDFTTASFSSTDPAVVTRRGTRIAACPATLDGMPAGSHVRAIAINVGDTTATDAGLAGYYDNVVVEQTSDTTVYDFEASPATRDECKKDGWVAFGFDNQGDCIQFFNTGK
jgi:hypothetical protein